MQQTTKQTRSQIFDSYANHPWLKKVYNRLTEADKQIAKDFIAKNDHLGMLEFEYAVNRMFLDKDRPKRFAMIQELLTCANCG